VTRISVVVPARDDAGYLRACLDSLARQSRPADEIVVVDDSSRDATGDVARAFGAVVVRRERAPGIPAAASAGYDAATGDVIARCDADSVLPWDWLERIEQTLAAHPDAVAVTGPARFYDLPRAGDLLARVGYLTPYFVLTRAGTANRPVFGSNFAMRRSAWEAARGRVHRDDPEVHDDMDLSFALPATARVLHDRRLVAGISGRPFHDPVAMLRRQTRATRTILGRGPEDLPWKRWWRLTVDRLRRVGLLG